MHTVRVKGSGVKQTVGHPCLVFFILKLLEWCSGFLFIHMNLKNRLTAVNILYDLLCSVLFKSVFNICHFLNKIQRQMCMWLHCSVSQLFIM